MRDIVDLFGLLKQNWWIVVPLVSAFVWAFKKIRSYSDLDLVGEPGGKGSRKNKSTIFGR